MPGLYVRWHWRSIPCSPTCFLLSLAFPRPLQTSVLFTITCDTGCSSTLTQNIFPLYLENVHCYSLLDLIGWHVDELHTLVELPQRQSLRQGFKCMWFIWGKGIEEKTVNEEYIIKQVITIDNQISVLCKNLEKQHKKYVTLLKVIPPGSKKGIYSPT